MSDDAVAPVVAMMLILAAVVTFFAAWNAYFVPSMKAQSEITHIGQVESGFLKFSSDIGTAVSLKKNLRLSESLPLGGGDFMFDPVRSGGEIRVGNTTPSTYFSLNWTNSTSPDHLTPDLQSPDSDANMAKFSYTPVNNFWQDQGYVWSLGNIFVNNTERNLVTPLEFDAMEDVTYDGLAQSLVELEPAAYSGRGDCTRIIVRTVNITPDTSHPRISGNGNAVLRLNCTVSRVSIVNATSLSLIITAPSGRFQETFWGYLDSGAENLRYGCPNVFRPAPSDPGKRTIQLVFTPNVTLEREIAEIRIGVS